MTGVPPMSSFSSEIADIVELLKQENLAKNSIVYDLGSGWGSLVIALAEEFPQFEIRGIEISPLPYWIARIRCRHLSNVTLYRGSFLNCDLREAGAVICYLMTGAMPKLAQLLDGMLKCDTPVIALTFWFRGRKVTKARNGPGLRGAAALYYWPAQQESTQNTNQVAI